MKKKKKLSDVECLSEFVRLGGTILGKDCTVFGSCDGCPILPLEKAEPGLSCQTIIERMVRKYPLLLFWSEGL